MRLLETNENDAVESPTPRDDKGSMPHRNTFNPTMDLTTVRARRRLSTCGKPVAIGL